MRNLWLDDIRTPPDDTWDWAKTATEAIRKLQAHSYDLVSLDHDLGNDEDGTGYDVVCYLERIYYAQGQNLPKKVQVHSANPVGSVTMKAVLNSIGYPQRFFGASW